MGRNSDIHHQLDAAECRGLADALGDTPETVISVHLLRRGLCRAYVAGDPSCFRAAIVQSDFSPDEPAAFGPDAQALWDVLRHVRRWGCVDVPRECAPGLGEIIRDKMGCSVRYVEDIYHVLSGPAGDFHHEAVRLLTPADLHLIESAPPELRGGGFASSRELLAEGIVAGAVVRDRLVSIAFTSARTQRHADIGVHTSEPWRRRGLARAAASIVAGRVQQAGQLPVWSTGDFNTASLSLARRLGFTEVSRSTYVVLGDSASVTETSRRGVPMA